jgi:hypothetical protein
MTIEPAREAQTVDSTTMNEIRYDKSEACRRSSITYYVLLISLTKATISK